jgi:hypothetical protein
MRPAVFLCADIRIWRMGYTQANGLKNSLSFGAYPAMSLGHRVSVNALILRSV